MSLGINTETSGEFRPYLKYDARAGRFFRAKNKDANEQSDVDVTHNFAALMDLEHIKIGWLHFPAGAAPHYVVQDISKGMPERPAGGQHKQGFVMNLMLAGNQQVYEMSSSSKATVGSFNLLHDEYLAAPESKQGKLPIVSFVGTNIIETSSSKGTTRNYQPVWKITGWVARPAVLDVKPEGAATLPFATSQQSAASPPATGQQQWSPPPIAAPASAQSFG
jgi:hypothetical protein